MNSIKQISFAFYFICLSLLLAGCSKPDPNGGRRISKVIVSTNIRELVEDVASGQTISDEYSTIIREESFIWDGDVLTNYTLINDGILLSSKVYSYKDGKLVEVNDECEGTKTFFYYSDGHLDHIIDSTESFPSEILQLFYDEHGRVKSIRHTLSDGSDYPDWPGIKKYVSEFEYSGSDVTRYACLYFHLIESEEPLSSVIHDYDYSTAVNPLRGIVTYYFVLDPWRYLSEHYICYERSSVNGGLKNEINHEVTMDQEYPIQVSASDSYSYITDGVRTKSEATSVTTFEYLD